MLRVLTKVSRLRVVFNMRDAEYRTGGKAINKNKLRSSLCPVKNVAVQPLGSRAAPALAAM
jgi:hypothetical protein